MSESELLIRFRKTCFWPWTFKNWEDRFTSLSIPEQKAFCQLLEARVDREYAFNAVCMADSTDLLVRFDVTVEAIFLKYRQGIAW